MWTNQKLRILSITAAVALTHGAINVASGATTFTTANDFFTTPWAFGAPYVRGINDTPTRSSIGVSTPNPFLFGNATTSSAEETTYFQFAFDPGSITGPVTKAVLQANMVPRQNSEPAISPTSPISISAHRVNADPMALINPSLPSGDGSFVASKNDHVAAAEDTISVGGAGVFEWDVTSLVMDWITNGESNFDYTIAMTARVGNNADTEETGLFHAFVNKEFNAAQAATLVVMVPEPAASAAIAGSLVLAASRRGRAATKESSR
jgi:hypothetical protein